MSISKLTPAQWEEARARALHRALKLTKSGPKARELRDAAVVAALEPDVTPWDPDRQTFGQYLADLVWSRYGNESKSYRVTMASDRITDENDRAPPSSRNPDRLVLRKEEETRAERLRAALDARVGDDPLVRLLMDRDEEDGKEEDVGGGGDDVPGDDPDPPVDPPAVQRVAQPPTTRRALAKGDTLEDVKNARRRLKRHAEAAATADEEGQS